MRVTKQQLTEEVVRNVLLAWYRDFSAQAPVEQLARYLAPDVELTFLGPEDAVKGREAFCAWWPRVCHGYFDERHEVEKLEVHVDGLTASADVTVRWEARARQPDAPRSQYVAYLARQRFRLVQREDGRVEIASKRALAHEATAPKYGY